MSATEPRVAGARLSDADLAWLVYAALTRQASSRVVVEAVLHDEPIGGGAALAITAQWCASRPSTMPPPPGSAARRD